LLFLALLIAVGVGLIVHFAENQKFECIFPDELFKGQAGKQLETQSKY